MASKNTAADEPMSWQAQKSASTRNSIVEAAIRCFVELGYARTTTTRIAEKAGLSRGAMLHHFPSKLDIVAAAVEHLQARRLKAFRKAVNSIPTGADRVKLAVNAYWKQVKHPLFIAIFELSVAARTDHQLAAILKPAQQQFEKEWYETARELFPEWGDDKEFSLAFDLTRYLMEGMAVSIAIHDQTARDDRLIKYLSNQIRVLRDTS